MMDPIKHVLRICVLLLALLLAGCFKIFELNLSGLGGLADSMHGAVSGAAEVFGYPERGRRIEGEPDVRCVASWKRTEKLCVCVGGDDENPQWFLRHENGDEIALGAISSAGESLGAFEVDRQWKYLAVITAAEGHPMLTVYDLEQWLRDKNPPEAVFVLNPYPGGVHLGGWENNQLLNVLSYGSRGLKFSSDGAVFEADKQKSAVSYPLESMKEYRILFPSKEIEEIVRSEESAQ